MEQVYWMCVNRTWKARRCTINNKLMKLFNLAHNYTPFLGVTVEVMLSAMKEHEASPAEPISHTVDSFYAQIEVGWVHSTPTVNAVKSTL